MMKMAKIYAILILATVPLSVQAFSFDEFFDEFKDFFSNGTSSSQIINEVNVSANTGGNVATGGEVIEGETKTKVEIKNIINGKEIDPVDIETKGSSVSVNSEIEVNDGIAEVQREIEIDSEKSVENYQVDLNDSLPAASAPNSVSPPFKNVQDWWANFVEDLKSFFQNIF